MEDGPAVAGEHPWLLVDNFTTSRRILNQCIALADDVHPSSKAHVDFTIMADRVLLALKSVYSSHTAETSGAEVSSQGLLQTVGRDVAALLTMAWTIKPTNVLKNMLGDAIDLFTDTLMSMADGDHLAEVDGYLETIDKLVSANPRGHGVQKLTTSKAKLVQFKDGLHQDQIKYTSPRWTIPCDRTDSRQLSQDIQAYYDAHHISTEDESQRLAIVKRLERAVRDNREWRDAGIQLYGSSLSTMGTRGCDMDLCLSWNTPTSGLFVSRNAAIAKARQAHELALQKRSNRTNGLDMLTQVGADLKKQTARLDELMAADKKPPASEKPTKKKARGEAIASTQFFVHALTHFVQTLERLKDTPASPTSRDLANQLADTERELQDLSADSKKRIKKLHRLTGVLMREGCTITNVISHARVPIIKFLHVPSNLECDLCMENTLATRNTGLLRAYGWFDPRVSPLVLAVKKWAKSRGVNDASQNTLSSYSYAILVIHFMQTLGILPDLQDPALLEQLNVPHETLNGYDVTFCADVAACRKIAKLNEMAELGVGDLLVLFFDYFAAFPWLSRVVSIRGTDQTKRDRWKSAAKTWRMSIEDPFETSRDLGIVLTATGQEKVLKEFGRAKNVLTENGSFAKLVAAPEKRVKAGGRDPKAKKDAGAAANAKPSKEPKGARNDSEEAGSTKASSTSPLKESADEGEQDAVGAPAESGAVDGPSTPAAPSKNKKAKKPRNKTKGETDPAAPSIASPGAPGKENSNDATGEGVVNATSARSPADEASKPSSTRPTRQKQQKIEKAIKMPARAPGTAAQNATSSPEHQVKSAGRVRNVQLHSHQNSMLQEPTNGQKCTPKGAQSDALPPAPPATTLPLPAPTHGGPGTQPLPQHSAAPSSQRPSRNRMSREYRAKNAPKATESS